MATRASSALPEGITSILDTDLYKLTMQCCVHKYFPDTEVQYKFTNRTPEKKFTRRAHKWIQEQIKKLANLSLTDDEYNFLKTQCPYLSDDYLHYLKHFRLRPGDGHDHAQAGQVDLTFSPDDASLATESDEDLGSISVQLKGLWKETILYEIPILAIISEAYFKFCDREWDHEGQRELAKKKGVELLKGGCLFSEFGSRRRRDYLTQELVLHGLLDAVEEQKKAATNNDTWTGALAGTSNVHFAHRFGLRPIGTVAHEWFMGVAAVTNDYEHASETALRYWVGTFGQGVLGIALTDTFGTPAFLGAFQQHVPSFTTAAQGPTATSASAANSTSLSTTDTLSTTNAPLHAPIQEADGSTKDLPPTYAQVFEGVRQDSGDPKDFIKMMRDFYDSQSISDKKTIVFSDSLNVEKCIEYKRLSESAGFKPTFGVGTFLTNDFRNRATGEKSVPLNIVIKISDVVVGQELQPAIKISDNIGKNTGDQEKVAEVKQRLGYTEKSWEGGDETKRWNDAQS